MPLHNPKTGDYPRAYGLLVALIILVAIITWFGSVANTSHKNKIAIEKSCILLNNAIIRSSLASRDSHNPSAALIAGVLAVIPHRFVREYESRLRNGTVTIIPLIDCTDVANHPEEIIAIPLKPQEVK